MGGGGYMESPTASRKPCIFFAKGNCRNGANCVYAHIRPTEERGGTTGDRPNMALRHLQQEVYTVEIPEGSPVFSIDVECVAINTKHDGRAVAHIAMVDFECKTVVDIVVKPAEPVVSCLTPLTNLTPEIVDGGVSLEEGLRRLRQVLPQNAILVGQSIGNDIAWLGLKEGVDF